MVMTHLAHRLDNPGLPISVWAIDTQLAADGWREYVSAVADELAFQDFNIYNNAEGFQEYVEWVKQRGCPRTKAAHKFCYRRLKERGINAIHMHYKQDVHDKTLFLSGIRKHEGQSHERAKLTQYIQRHGHTNKIFANPLFFWTDEDIAR